MVDFTSPISLSDLIAVSAVTVTAIVALFVLYFTIVAKRADFIEQSFDVLQRVNEKALSSDENLMAAVRSLAPDDALAIDKAREIYFHFMRLNRVYRVWEYRRRRLIRKSEAQAFYAATLPTLYHAQFLLDRICERGYPTDFQKFLQRELRKVRPVDPFEDARTRSQATINRTERV